MSHTPPLSPSHFAVGTSPACLMRCPPLSPQLLNSLSPEEGAQCRRGLHFQDGERRVDYVLTYHVKKPGSSRSRRHSSRIMESALARSIRRARAPPPRDDPEIAAQEHSLDYHEDDKLFRREEFEGNLQEMGLELEKDEDVSNPGWLSSVYLALFPSFFHQCSPPPIASRLYGIRGEFRATAGGGSGAGGLSTRGLADRRLFVLP